MISTNHSSTRICAADGDIMTSSYSASMFGGLNSLKWMVSGKNQTRALSYVELTLVFIWKHCVHNYDGVLVPHKKKISKHIWLYSRNISSLSRNFDFILFNLVILDFLI